MENSKLSSICKMKSSEPSTSEEQSTSNENLIFDLTFKKDQSVPTNIEMIKTNKEQLSPSVFEFLEELLLLELIECVKNPFHCNCKTCAMKEVQIQAYRLASKYQKSYPCSWNIIQQADSEWLTGFEERHSARISQFRLKCTAVLSQKSMSKPQFSSSVLTFIEEELLLKLIEHSKNQFDCICKLCLLGEIQVLVYSLARLHQRSYPSSWDKDQQADDQWLNGFQERHSEQISKLRLECMLEAISQEPEVESQSSSVFSTLEEILLLRLIEYVKSPFDCKCKLCFMKEVQNRAYLLANTYHKSYPLSWDENERADDQWLSEFKKRHIYRFSQYPLVCKKTTTID